MRDGIEEATQEINETFTAFSEASLPDIHLILKILTIGFGIIGAILFSII